MKASDLLIWVFQPYECHIKPFKTAVLSSLPNTKCCCIVCETYYMRNYRHKPLVTYSSTTNDKVQINISGKEFSCSKQKQAKQTNKHKQDNSNNNSKTLNKKGYILQ